jgi:hypothetical protein
MSNGYLFSFIWLLCTDAMSKRVAPKLLLQRAAADIAKIREKRIAKEHSLASRPGFGFAAGRRSVKPQAKVGLPLVQHLSIHTAACAQHLVVMHAPEKRRRNRRHMFQRFTAIISLVCLAAHSSVVA